MLLEGLRSALSAPRVTFACSGRERLDRLRGRPRLTPCPCQHPPPATSPSSPAPRAGSAPTSREELARRGHELVLVARSADKLAGARRRARAPPRTSYRSTCPTATLAPACSADLEARGLVPQVLVNNAGLLHDRAGAHAATPSGERDLVEVDVMAVVDLCSRFLPGMVQRGRGAVLNVASTAAFQPLPGQAAYGAAKAFVLSYTRSLSGELKGTGVTPTVLCPGPVDTGFGEAAGFSKEEADDALPQIMWLPAAEVARQAVAGMDKGTLVVIPGVANKLGAGVRHPRPRSGC